MARLNVLLFTELILTTVGRI